MSASGTLSGNQGGFRSPFQDASFIRYDGRSLSVGAGNEATRVHQNVEVGQKRLELLRELLPAATIVAVIVDPLVPAIAEQLMRNMQAAAPALGMQLHVLHASTDRDLDTVFADLSRLRADVLIIGPRCPRSSRPASSSRPAA